MSQRLHELRTMLEIGYPIYFVLSSRVLNTIKAECKHLAKIINREYIECSDFYSLADLYDVGAIDIIDVTKLLATQEYDHLDKITILISPVVDIIIADISKRNSELTRMETGETYHMEIDNAIRKQLIDRCNKGITYDYN